MVMDDRLLSELVPQVQGSSPDVRQRLWRLGRPSLRRTAVDPSRGRASNLECLLVAAWSKLAARVAETGALASWRGGKMPSP